MAQSRSSTSSDKPRSGAAASPSNKERPDGKSEASHQSGKTADLSEQAQDAMGQAQDQAGKLVGQAQQQAKTQLASQKERAASTVGTLAGALHEASRQVREQDDARMAGYIDSAAGQLDALSDTLNQQDIGQILDSAGRYARRQPAIFFAAAVAVGFLGARFLKSSAQFSGRDGGSDGYESSRGRFSGDGGAMGSGYGGDLAGGWQARSTFDAGPEGQ
jgi:hypothetical protein